MGIVPGLQASSSALPGLTCTNAVRKARQSPQSPHEPQSPAPGRSSRARCRRPRASGRRCRAQVAVGVQRLRRRGVSEACRVWSTSGQSGVTGYHKCDQGYGIGYSIEVTDCSTERRYDLDKRPISEWDRFKVHVVAKGVPFYRSFNMHVNAYPSGNITGH